MTRDAQFEALASMWADVFEDAQVLCRWLHGNGHADEATLAAAQRAFLEDEDPRSLVADPPIGAFALSQ
jgi:hypothetical protein